VGHDASSIESEIDRLYQLPLKAFTQERNALAARLREAGAAEAAERVKSLAKPPVSAWAVNQVYWTARRDFDELIDASDRLRALQARGVTPNELRDVMRERRDALGAALRRGQAALAAQGHGANAAITQRLATTLEALAAYGSGRPSEILPGRLVVDVDPPGFEAWALAAAPSPRPALAGAAKEAVDPEPNAGSGADAEQERAERLRLERDLATCRRRAQDARSAADEMARRAEGAQRELAEAERRLVKAKERAQETAAAAEKADAAVRQAAEELSAAERALEAAGGTRDPDA
jgi:type IV secretory pathway VirB10-like protein